MAHEQGCGCSDCANGTRGNPGDPGKSKYLYIGYASDNAGSDFSLVPNDNLEWIQFLVRDSSATTLTVADFTGTCVRFIGNYGGFSTDFVFTTSVIGDPGTGQLGFGNANVIAATEINVSLTNASGMNVTAFLSQIGQPTSTIKSLVRVFRNDASTAFYAVTNVVILGTYAVLTITTLGATNSSPFAAGDKVVLTYANTGDEGAPGSDGGRLVVNDHTAVSTPGTGSYDNLIGGVLPVIMENDGDQVVITTRFSVIPSTTNKGFKLLFGASSLFSVNFELANAFQKGAVMQSTVSRINATTVAVDSRFFWMGLYGGQLGTPYSEYQASVAVPDLDVNTTNIIAQGKSFTVVGDVTCEYLTVDYKMKP